MFIFGFNLSCGKAISHPGGKMERLPRAIGIGIGWTRSEFTRVMKGQGQSHEKSEK